MDIIGKGIIDNRIIITLSICLDQIKIERMEEVVDVNNLTDDEIKRYIKEYSTE